MDSVIDSSELAARVTNEGYKELPVKIFS